MVISGNLPNNFPHFWTVRGKKYYMTLWKLHHVLAGHSSFRQIYLAAKKKFSFMSQNRFLILLAWTWSYLLLTYLVKYVGVISLRFLIPDSNECVVDTGVTERDLGGGGAREADRGQGGSLISFSAHTLSPALPPSLWRNRAILRLEQHAHHHDDFSLQDREVSLCCLRRGCWRLARLLHRMPGIEVLGFVVSFLTWIFFYYMGRCYTFFLVWWIMNVHYSAVFYFSLFWPYILWLRF